MKLLFLCAASVLAARDIEPPVISLTMPAISKMHSNQSHHLTPDVTLDATQENSDRNLNGERSVTCEVGTSNADVAVCPKPTCSAWDHHDGVLPCAESFIMVNNDGTPQASGAAESDIQRGLRSEWLLKYDATDHSNNKAHTVSFTMIFQDTRTPKLETEFGTSNWEHEEAHAQHANDVGSRVEINEFDSTDYTTHPWMESCYAKEASHLRPGEDNYAAQCEYELNRTVAAYDEYDQNVTGNVIVRVCTKTTVSDARNGCTGAWVQTDKPSTILADDWTIDSHDVTNYWVVEYRACDNAGIFGYQEKDNCGVQRNVIKISDNTKPVITLNDHTNQGTLNVLNVTCTGTDDDTCTIECRRSASLYTDPGAQCYDARESWDGKTKEDEDADVTYFLANGTEVTDQNGADSTHVARIGRKLFPEYPTTGQTADKYNVNYNCDDGQGNNAITKTRLLTVVDRTPPTVSLPSHHVIENSAGAHIKDADDFEKTTGLNVAYDGGGLGDVTKATVVTCSDSCDANPFIAVTLHEGGCDVAGAKATGSLVGNGHLSNWDDYKTGIFAIQYTCYDHYDRALTHADHTPNHGDQTYTNGDGRDSLSHSVCRKINNVDHTHPVIQILGSDDMKLEASQEGNYVDDGATCSDQVDGVISHAVEVSGDVVNLAKVGIYTVTYHCKDSAGNAAPPISRIVTVEHTTCPRCTITAFENSITHEASFPYVDQGAECSDGIDGALAVHVRSGPLGDCEWDNSEGKSECKADDDGVNTELTGTYVVTYRAKNSVGLWNDGNDDNGDATASPCRNNGEDYYRTVVVADSLKPVMQITYDDEVVSRSNHVDQSFKWTASGKVQVNNPDMTDKFTGSVLATDSYSGAHSASTYSLMAESTSTGGSAWLVAAAGAAAAGLALLAASQRRTVVSVPV